MIEFFIGYYMLVYYNGNEGMPGEKNTYGPDDEEENKTWWPDISTKEDMVKSIHFDEILIKNDSIYILFNRDWGGPDYDDNGVAVEIKNNKVSRVGYKDIGYQQAPSSFAYFKKICYN